jgi:hypothetical protein
LESSVGGGLDITEVPRLPAREITPYKPAENISKQHTQDYKIAILIDCQEANSNLQRMISSFQKLIPNVVTIYNLHDIHFKSGCLSCLYCTVEGKCVILDDFQEKYSEFVSHAASSL